MKKSPQLRSLRSRWSRVNPVLGAWCMLPDRFAAEVVASQEFDFVCIDAQHGMIDYRDVAQLIQVLELGEAAPVVRVPWNEPGIIGKVLDAGAMSVIVPMVNSADDARALVAAARYAPHGSRSFGPVGIGLRDGADYLRRTDDEVAVIVMIETAIALRDVDQIAAVPGIDALFLGPFDLSLSLGLPPGDNDGVSVFDDAIASVLRSCRENNLKAGILSNHMDAPRRVAQGFDMISVTTDIQALSRSMADDLNSVKSRVGAAAASRDNHHA
ncbi:HpcH/HpaI aldolase family protein [Bradyrhizobium neotropicale]|uniref:Aldolase n=1 Tax=Bradyrhizobium neotropicale TaxID=1497615 RepID=A0A176ZFV8_9BRAD|nr:aldolase/citrate lyase family protein [Bradyrhizobium neotropicale]OAF18812.1 aldolase [Bradyrhizobium neotropicale]